MDDLTERTERTELEAYIELVRDTGNNVRKGGGRERNYHFQRSLKFLSNLKVIGLQKKVQVFAS